MDKPTVHSSLSRLTGQGFLVFFVLCLAFSVLTAVYNLWLSLLEILLVLILSLVFRAGTNRRREEVAAYLDSMTLGVDAASRRTMISSPLPIVIFQPDSDDIIWSNELFLHMTGDREHIFETKLSALVPAYQSQWLMDGAHVCPDPVAVGERQYLVFGNLVNTEGESGYLATTYWVDVTQYASIAETFQDTRPILGLIQIDNYDDLCRGLEEGDRAILRSRIHEKIVQWTAPARCVLLRYSRENYLCLSGGRPVPGLRPPEVHPPGRGPGHREPQRRGRHPVHGRGPGRGRPQRAPAVRLPGPGHGPEPGRRPGGGEERPGLLLHRRPVQGDGAPHQGQEPGHGLRLLRAAGQHRPGHRHGPQVPGPGRAGGRGRGLRHRPEEGGPRPGGPGPLPLSRRGPDKGPGGYGEV